jgi:hypothetical protein
MVQLSIQNHDFVPLIDSAQGFAHGKVDPVEAGRLGGLVSQT